jgi:hypothetical protein
MIARASFWLYTCHLNNNLRTLVFNRVVSSYTAKQYILKHHKVIPTKLWPAPKQL